MTLLTVGQRVQTPMGPATILGFESFNQRGFSNPVSDEDTGGRVVCKLDHPENWMHTVQTPNPFMFRSQLQELKE